MPRTAEQYEEIRKQKRLVIMTAALELFAEDGYHATSISKIAKKANISKGLMYNYFSGKDELLNEIIDDGFRKMMNNFDLNKDSSLTDKEFVIYIESMFEIMEKEHHFWKVYFSLMLQSDISEIIANKTEEWYSQVYVILIDFFKRKNIEDPETEAILFGAMLDGLGMNFIMNPSLFPKEPIIKSIIKKYVSD
jgi:AcrR family transcriptional regulator